MKRFVMTLLLLSITTGFLAGCNTMAGAGKDVKAAGQEVEDTAKGH